MRAGIEIKIDNAQSEYIIEAQRNRIDSLVKFIRSIRASYHTTAAWDLFHEPNYQQLVGEEKEEA